MRVALYIRVSTAEQSLHGLSVDAQTAALDQWAEGKSVVDHYVDLGVSARSPAAKRPELQRMLRDCEAGKIDLIAFTKLDRFFRNVKEYYKVEDVLERCGVSWQAIHEDYETVTASGRLKVNIMLAVAQDEADRTSERIKAVFQRKREKGLVPTGTVPIGIRIEDGKYAPSDDAQKVRGIFQTYIDSRSFMVTGRSCGYSYNGVKQLLQNETYLKTGVIDRDTWDTVQAIMASRSERHVRSDRVYLFAGLLMCPHCGRRLSSFRSTGYTYYRCMRHYYADCPGINVSEKRVEKYLLSHLMEEIEEFNLTVTDKKKPIDVNALRKKQDKLTDLYMSDLINREKYEEDFKALQTQIDDAERERRPIDAHEVTSLLQAYDEWSPSSRKVFWSNLLRSITPTEEGYDFALNYT